MRAFPWILFLALETVFLFLARTPDLLQEIDRFHLLYGAAFALFGVAALPAVRRDLDPRLILLGAVAFRLTLLPTTPTLSDDIYRYLWEGKVQLAGHNPFALAPDDPALEGLRDRDYLFINHKDVSTIYPPLSQLFFLAVAAADPTVLGMKVALVLADLALLLVLLRLIVRRGRPPSDVVLYAWHPLVIVEVAGSGHNDVVGTLFLLLGFAAWEEGRRNRAALALALAALAKLLPIVLLFFLRSFRRLLLGLAVVALAFLPYADAREGLYAGALVYARDLRFNAGFFALLDHWLAPGVARAAAGMLFAALVFLAFAKRASLPTAALIVTGAGLCLTSQFHPWYLLWILPLVTLRPALSWHVLAFTSMFSYRVHAMNKFEGVWEESVLLRLFEYIPFYVLLAFEGLREWKKVRRARRVRKAEAFARDHGLVGEERPEAGPPPANV